MEKCLVVQSYIKKWKPTERDGRHFKVHFQLNLGDLDSISPRERGTQRISSVGHHTQPASTQLLSPNRRQSALPAPRGSSTRLIDIFQFRFHRILVVRTSPFSSAVAASSKALSRRESGLVSRWVWCCVCVSAIRQLHPDVARCHAYNCCCFPTLSLSRDFPR